MSGHTPGPWLVTNHTIYALDETGGCNRVSTSIQGGYSYHGRTVKEQTEENELAANTRLIAAAPELLDALEAILNAGWRERNVHISTARAVVARARGE